MQRPRPLIAGNWKMYKLPSEAVGWLEDFQRLLATQPHDRCDVLLNVPFTHLTSMRNALASGSTSRVSTTCDASTPTDDSTSGGARASRGARASGGRESVSLGAQDLSPHAEGAYTGEVSGGMLSDAGARFVIVGHSERRRYHAEDDTLVRAKLEAALTAGLVPILCVGEMEDERDAGRANDVVLRQLGAALAGAQPIAAHDVVIAYEPVWAIGTGKTATAEDAQSMAATIRAALVERFPTWGRGIRLLYGGSMKPANAAELLAKPDIDGGLIGGASLDAESLLAIIAAAQMAGRASVGRP